MLLEISKALVKPNACESVLLLLLKWIRFYPFNLTDTIRYFVIPVFPYHALG